eukprot:gnl/MRDRNA2_/MRDRNA2_188776_c0_seq1.p1 gnl/MRDRNA2_/MRDRNA2_188776_c0~~gnl/MRDRNA2_/MRDRNA2_188776_c0_seq1.p1  ORF type:complete len:115 (-),score=12.75 gnl/MRDRNA2_/MRDRNA2_188776_c0_seq1:8-352(-)
MRILTASTNRRGLTQLRTMSCVCRAAGSAIFFLTIKSFQAWPFFIINNEFKFSHHKSPPIGVSYQMGEIMKASTVCDIDIPPTDIRINPTIHIVALKVFPLWNPQARPARRILH